jgi:3-dehydroquinate synthase
MSSKDAKVRKVHVELGARSYDVLIGRGLLADIGQEMRKRGLQGPVAIVTDTLVGSYNIDQAVKKGLASVETFLTDRSEIDSQDWLVPAGESSKRLSQVEELLSRLVKRKIPRSGTIIALGGGVIGDLAGFAAAIYQRGINFVQVPTTLLAMVDSSVGGKTGVNLPDRKNMVGAFHQPKLVVADLATLDTLPPREFAAGMAEVIKYGAIADKALFERVAEGVKPQDKGLAEIIEKCVAIKARIVENDEFETKGERALLNFGHTIGHAIEGVTGYTTYLHGEAISLGMRAAAWLSVWEAGLPEAEARKIEATLVANHLPVTLKSEVDEVAILSALGNDKKVAADGQNRWVLLKSLGKASGRWEIPPIAVKRALAVLR